MRTKYNGRPVEYEIEHGADPCDSFICQANYTDGNFEDLNDDEMNELQIFEASNIDQDWMERQISKAEFYGEGDR